MKFEITCKTEEKIMKRCAIKMCAHYFLWILGMTEMVILFITAQIKKIRHQS
jgi:hypothetical protein